MTIVEQTLTLLHLRSREPELMVMAGLGGVMVLAFGLIMLRSSSAWFHLLMSGGAIFAGSLAVILALASIPLQVTYRFDKASHQFMVVRHFALGTRRSSYPLSAIQAVKVVQEEDSDRIPHYEISITLTSGQQISVRHLSQCRERSLVIEIAQTLHQFLGLNSPPPHLLEE